MSDFAWFWAAVAVILSSMFFSMALGGSGSSKTPEQMREKIYADCVRNQYVNRRDVALCSDIKP